MTAEDCILFYRKAQCIHRDCHLNWLKENLNPILRALDPNMNISWSCQTCMKNYMNMLLGWYDRKEKENDVKKKTSVARKKKKQTKRKN